MLNKNYIFIALAFFLVVALSFVSSYTAPTLDSVNFTLCSGYIAPTLDSINFSLGLDDACGSSPPTYSDNQANNTIGGKFTLFSILWNDSVSLNNTGQYIFSTNNTGTWVNDSAINFTTTPSWANVTKTLNSTTGLVIGYRWYATNNEQNAKSTEIFTLTITDGNPPSVLINSPINQEYDVSEILFSVNATDDVAVDSCWANIGGDNFTLERDETFCYQESATVSNQTGIDGDCNLVYTGAYDVGDFDSWTGHPPNTYDGDFDTYAKAYFFGGGANFYINYTKPLNSVGVNFIQKNGISTFNNNIPSICFSQEILQFYWYADAVEDVGRSYCWNSSAWLIIDETANHRVYEEAVNWTISPAPYIYINSSVPDGEYTANFFCNDTAGNLNNTESVDFSILTNTCTYPGSGDWEVNCNDNCSITSPVDLGGNDLSILGHGTFITTANISNIGQTLIAGDSSSLQCEVPCSDGGCFE